MMDRLALRKRYIPVKAHMSHGHMVRATQRKVKEPSPEQWPMTGPPQEAALVAGWQQAVRSANTTGIHPLDDVGLIHPKGARVKFSYGPHKGQRGVVMSANSKTGAHRIRLDDGSLVNMDPNVDVLRVAKRFGRDESEIVRRGWLRRRLAARKRASTPPGGWGSFYRHGEPVDAHHEANASWIAEQTGVPFAQAWAKAAMPGYGGISRVDLPHRAIPKTRTP